MVKNTINTICEVSDTKARFQEIAIEKQSDGTWSYTKDPFHRIGIGTKVGTLYEKFIQKVCIGKAKKELSKINTILCNSVYAADLWLNKTITDVMIKSIKMGVVGEGQGLTPLIIIPKQEVLLDEELIMLKMVIVDSFSHHGFEFIDSDNNTLQW